MKTTTPRPRKTKPASPETTGFAPMLTRAYFSPHYNRMELANAETIQSRVKGDTWKTIETFPVILIDARTEAVRRLLASADRAIGALAYKKAKKEYNKLSIFEAREPKPGEFNDVAKAVLAAIGLPTGRARK